MSTLDNNRRSAAGLALRITFLAAASLTAAAAQAAVPGIVGTVSGAGVTFDLTASAERITQPDGNNVYSWGYGCTGGPASQSSLGGQAQSFFLPGNWNSPAAPAGAAQQSAGNAAIRQVCPLMQVPGPTMIVQEGTQVTVNLTNALPLAAGNTSIMFPGMQVATSGGVSGRVTAEAAHGGTVSYTFTAGKPGTYAYYSATQADLQIEMGLYGALIVVPTTTVTPPGTTAQCKKGPYSLAANAYDNVYTCYDREYLFQLSEMSLKIHEAAEAQAAACDLAGTATCAQIQVEAEPYRADYFLINGRSMPDDMDAHYSQAYFHQPYNANPHMLPGENLLIRFIGQGRIQHPFHIHGNHARVLARDGNLITAATDIAAGLPLAQQRLAGPVLFTLPSVSGQTIDAVFNWTGKGLGWDVYGANTHTCNPDANGFDVVTKEWCADHGKPIPVTPPDPNVVATGQWYAGTPYLGIQEASPTPLPPTGARLVATGGYAYMWHSHDEREITTQNVFPGGLMTMLIIDPPGTAIDETQ
jgi:Multicopper oxidase